MSILSYTPNKQYPSFSSLVYPQVTVNTQVVTSGTTPVTVTAAQILGGMLIVDCQDTGTITLPTAALLVAGIDGISIGTSFIVNIRNAGDTVLTVSAGTGGTVSGTATISNGATKPFLFVFSGVLPGVEAFTAYSLGSSTF